MSQNSFQNLIKTIVFVLSGVLFLGALIDGIGNSFELINFTKALVGTILIFTIWLGLKIWLIVYKPFWKSGNKKIRVIRLNKKINLFALGMIILLWIPTVANQNIWSNKIPCKIQIVDSKTNQPLDSVLIEIPTLSFQNLTSSNGLVEVPKKKEFVINLSKTGYQPIDKETITLNSDCTVITIKMNKRNIIIL